MDSGNSASMQSSSGGDEEYASRGESISSFLTSSAHLGSISEPPQRQPPPPLLSHQPIQFRHSHSQNLDAFPASLANPSGNNAQYAHDVLWSRGLRSDPGNYANFGNITALSASSTSSSAQSVLNVQGHNQTLPPQSSIDANNAAAKASVLQSDHQLNPVKNPKKRTRASRRAPTAILTTDTTNFRQMVQEFTGIPTAPFAAGSPYSRRLDLFSTGTSNLSSVSHLEALGPLYPVRPSAQKVQFSASSLLHSQAMIDSLVSSTTNSGNTVIPSQHILNMQNQMLSFQGNNTTTTNSSATNATINNNDDNNTSIPSFLKLPSQKHHLSSSSSSAMLTGNSSQGINMSIPSFDDLGLGHHQNVNVNASLNSGLFPTSSERWRGGGGSSAAFNDHHNLDSSSFDGGNKPQHLSNNYSKFNCSASTSEFLHHDKGLENATSGGEGSWICPSD